MLCNTLIDELGASSIYDDNDDDAHSKNENKNVYNSNGTNGNNDNYNNEFQLTKNDANNADNFNTTVSNLNVNSCSYLLKTQHKSNSPTKHRGKLHQFSAGKIDGKTIKHRVPQYILSGGLQLKVRYYLFY